MRTFEEDLRWADHVAQLPWWDSIYRKTFPGMLLQTSTKGNNQSQHLGHDRIVHLESGRTHYVQEKYRRRLYRDILLEYRSNDRLGTPGWIEKDLQIDFLAYAFIREDLSGPHQVFFFPWPSLRRAWQSKKSVWLKRYRRVRSYSDTLSVAIPEQVLRHEVLGRGLYYSPRPRVPEFVSPVDSDQLSLFKESNP